MGSQGGTSSSSGRSRDLSKVEERLGRLRQMRTADEAVEEAARKARQIGTREDEAEGMLVEQPGAGEEYDDDHAASVREATPPICAEPPPTALPVPPLACTNV